MLKFKLTKEEHEQLDDAHKTLYKVAGEGFALEVDGVVDKTVHDEFRANNVDLMKKQSELAGVDINKYNTMLATEQKIRNKELIDKGDFDTLLAEHTSTMRADFEGKLATLGQTAETATTNYNSLATKTHIEGAAMKSFATHNIRPDANEAVMAQIKAKFSLDNGKAISRLGDTVEAGANGNLTIDEFVANQPAFMRVPNTPGASKADENNNIQQTETSSSVTKITGGLKELMNK